MSTTLQASLAPVLNRVVITNLQKNVDKDFIVLHLEQRKVMLLDDVEVTIEEFEETSRAAIVSFTDASGRPFSNAKGLGEIQTGSPQRGRQIEVW